MSYLVHLVVPYVSKNPDEVWRLFDTLNSSDGGDGPPAPPLLQLHDTLTKVYPCLSSYAANDPGVDDSPWSDGPLIDNFGSQTAVLGLSGEHLDEVLPFIVESAGVIGLTVLDPQTGAVHVPLWVHPTHTWRVLVRGLRAGFDRPAVVAALARTFSREPAAVDGIFDVARACVQKGLTRLDAIQYRAVLRKLGCDAVIERDPGAPRKVFTEIDLAGGNEPYELEFLKVHAANGHANHQYELGFLLQHGVDLPRDEEAAVSWYEKAALQGYARAQCALGECYENGQGVARDARQAGEWFLRAAQQGDARAQGRYAAWLILEAGGDPAKNRRLAIFWAGKAAAQGDPDAARFLQRLQQPGQ